MRISERSDYLDILRAVAILLVVFIHSFDHLAEIYNIDSLPYAYFFHGMMRAIGRLGVPIFFMVSGAILLRRDVSVLSFYKKRIPRLLVSLIFIPILYEMFCFAALGYPAHKMLVPKILAGNPGYAYHLWFLYTTIGIYLAAPFLQYFINNGPANSVKIYLLVSFCLGFLPRLVQSFTGVALPYVMMDFFNAYITYFVLGYYLHNMFNGGKNIHILLTVMFLSVVVPAFILQFFPIYGDNFTIKSDVLLWHDKPFIFIGAICLFLMAKLVEKFEKINSTVMCVVKYISSSSYTIYLFHVGVIYYYKNFIGKFGCFFFSVLLLVVACIFICFALNRVFKKIFCVRKIFC